MRHHTTHIIPYDSYGMGPYHMVHMTRVYITWAMQWCTVYYKLWLVSAAERNPYHLGSTSSTCDDDHSRAAWYPLAPPRKDLFGLLMSRGN